MKARRLSRRCKLNACATIGMLLASMAMAATPEYTYKMIHVYPHDRTSFTEGLEYRGGFLYESTGEEGHSVLRKMKLETGEVVQQIQLAPHLFGEGFTILQARNRAVDLSRRSSASCTTWRR